MSARRHKVILSPEAAADLHDIFNYSTETWGLQQAKQYRTELHAGLRLIADQPEIGLSRPEFGPDVRSRRIGSHVGIYKIIDDKLMILRFLHHRQDVIEIMAPEQH
jgi:toxin ParE1/3/4